MFGLCQMDHRIEGMRFPFIFEGAIRQAIHQLKYRNIRTRRPLLAGLLYEYLLKYPLPGDTLVPVPLHRMRLRERGYNQSGLLVGDLSKLVGLPLVEDGLVRHRYAATQARTTNVNERQNNVAGSFTCRNRKLKDKAVLPIDNVATSGITFDAFASELKVSEAISLWGLVVAREI